MDYSIAIIVPSTEVASTAHEALKIFGSKYPVITASQKDAVNKAKELIPLGVRLIISNGITYQYLQDALDIPLLELPFGGLDVMSTVQKALQTNGRIVHVGTKPFYRYICRSLENLNIPSKRIYFHELNKEQTIDSQVLTLLDYGFDVFIGGYPVVSTAQNAGKIGIEFNVSEEIIQTTVKNAQSLVKLMIRQDEDYALHKTILEASSDGLIVTDEENKILLINQAALSLFQCERDSLIGHNLLHAFTDNHLVDSKTLSDVSDLLSDSMVPVLLKEVPIILKGGTKGSVISIKKASEIYEMQYELRKDLLVKGFIAKHNFRDIISKSSIMQSIKEKAYTYAQYDSTILIYGETGCGKELFAQSIHNASKRKNQPFIAVNCAALPDHLIESELFGYTKGAFTGANSKGKQGLFEQADHGTIFLDEISELPIPVQSKLLRVIQEGDMIRIGGDKVIHVDVRILCSSNKNLLSLIDEGKFKNDLYYRLCTLEINIPPLRERKEDILPLASALLYQYSKKHNKIVNEFSSDVLKILSQMDFPGNVRQLGNIIERMVILSSSSIIDLETLKKCDLPLDHLKVSESYVPMTKGPKTMNDIQLQIILDTIKECNGNKTAAAHKLGIHPSTLWRRLKKEGLQ